MKKFLIQTEQTLSDSERTNQNRKLGRSLRAIQLHQKVRPMISETLKSDGFIEFGELTAAGEAKLAELRRCLQQHNAK
jgi:hypothetical protein